MNEPEFNKQVEELKEIAARSINPCLTAKFVSLSDNRVRALFLKKLEEGYAFKEIRCLTVLSVPENRHVYFDFDCPNDRVCLIKPAFVVVVNVIDGRVVDIIDPYTGPTVPANAQSLSVIVPAAVADQLGNVLPFARNSSFKLSDGTLPLANDGTLPLGDGTLPLRVLGYVLLPAGWRFGNG